MLEIFNVRTDIINARDCTRGLYGHLKRVFTEKITLGENSLAALGNGNLRQRRAGSTLYQLSYIPAP